MIRKASLFAGTVFLLAIVWNCTKKPFKQTTFKVRDIEIQNQVFTSGGFTEVATVGPTQDFELLSFLTGDILVAQNKSAPFSFFPSAYASEPAPPRLEDEVTALRITSLYDFDSSYRAGTNLIGLFNNEGFGIHDSNHVVPEMYSFQQTSRFKLMQKPTMDTVQQFVIQVTFLHSGTFTDTAAAVTFIR
jgi:hypothetical protein